MEVPRGHSVMFTILHMDVDGVYSGCDLDGVCLYVNTQPLLLGCYCDDVLDGPWLLRTEVLHVHFVSYPPQGNRTGFKLHFSFHRQSALLTSVYPGQYYFVFSPPPLPSLPSPPIPHPPTPKKGVLRAQK